jgi:hypothetical protein
MAGSADLFRKMLDTGEEQFGKIASALLRNEQFVSTLHTAVGRALDAKGLVDRQVSSTLSAMHVPSRQDLQKLNDRLEEIERIFEELSRKVDGIAGKLNQKG